MKVAVFVRLFLIAALGFFAFIFGGSAARASDSCTGSLRLVALKKGPTVQVGFYDAVQAQGTMIFVLGHQKRFQETRDLIQEFCTKGFSVAAFNINAKHPSRQDYLNAMSTIVDRVHERRPGSRLILYGWGRGARVASKFAYDHKKVFTRIILENPDLDTRSAIEISKLPRHTTRVFACPAEIKSQHSNFALLKKTQVLVPAHAPYCAGQISSYSEARGPFADFIESDFAGVQVSNWYWTKKL